MQEVQLDKNVRLLDCPGIVMATGNDTSAHSILRNAVKVEQIADPAAPVNIILSRCRKDQMMLQYKVRPSQNHIKLIMTDYDYYE